MRLRPVRIMGLAAAIGAGCVGSIDRASDDPADPAAMAGAATGPAVRAGGAPGGSVVAACQGARVGPPPLRRLTRLEYDNTVRDLFGDGSQPARAFLPDERIGPFSGNVTAPVAELAVAQYAEAAERIAARAAQDLSAVVGCDPKKTAEEPCVQRLLGPFARRVHRRPLLAIETESYRALYGQIRAATGDAAQAARAVLQAMLQSPGFLYHEDRVDLRASDGRTGRLDGDSLAARLSYFLWRAPPDPALLAAVDAGEFARAEGLENQARRMLADPRAAAGIAAFAREWLGVEEIDRVEVSEDLAPLLPAALRADMRTEAEAFVGHVMSKARGSLETLLTAPLSLLNARLAIHYGARAPAGAGFAETMLDPASRAGVLTQGAFLGVHHSYVRRGKLVREAMLCHEMPPPPADVNPTLPEPRPGQTPRQRFEAHMNDSACSGCHRLMDPIGFAFDAFDEIGRARARYAGTDVPVDTRGALEGTRDADGAVRGVPELARRLAGSAQVHECVARQAFGFALGRPLGPADDCSVREAVGAFTAAQLDLRELLVAVVRSAPFSQVAVAP